MDFVHRIADLDPLIANIEPHVAALGASVSVADCDGDGWMDLYFTSSRFGEPNGLFRNRGDGTFEAIDDGIGVAGMNSRPLGASMGSVWGDFDNDGHEDLLVFRYGKLTLLRNLGGCRFEDVTARARTRPDLMYSAVTRTSPNIDISCPPSRSCSAAALPL